MTESVALCVNDESYRYSMSVLVSTIANSNDPLALAIPFEVVASCTSFVYYLGLR